MAELQLATLLSLSSAFMAPLEFLKLQQLNKQVYKQSIVIGEASIELPPPEILFAYPDFDKYWSTIFKLLLRGGDKITKIVDSRITMRNAVFI